MSVGFFILGVFAEKGEPGYPFQVLALPSSGCGLFTSIPHATVNKNLYVLHYHSTLFHFDPEASGEKSSQETRQRLVTLGTDFLAKISPPK